MAIVGYFVNIGSSITTTGYTVANGTTTMFYRMSAMTDQAYLKYVDAIQAETLIVQDINGVVLTNEQAFDSINDMINDIRSAPIYAPYAYNAIISKYIIAVINKYLIDNNGTYAHHDMIDGLIIALMTGLKSISLGYITNLSDPFYTSTFKNKIQDLINVSFI